MRKYAEIIELIAATSKTSEKQQILKDNMDHTLEKVLEYTLNPFKLYGITQKSISAVKGFSHKYSSIFELCDELASSNINDQLRNEVNLFLMGEPDENVRDLYIKILTKDLRCGVSDKTVNKIVKGLISAWEVQQAYPIEKYKLKPKEWVAISQKLNGSRGSYFNGEIKSRQNKVFNGLEHILDDIKSLELEGWLIDGELIRDNIDGLSDNENFRKSLSILAADGIDKSNIIFNVYDIVPGDEFAKGESKLKYPKRINQLEELSKKVEWLGLKHIKVLPILYQGNDHSQIEKWLEYADNNNWEGCMLYRDSTYKCKRHSGILKVKSFKHCDVKCINVYEGEGKYQGSLGGIVVKYKGYDCGCGGGSFLTDAMRKHLWEHPEEILNKIVQIKYKEESQNKQGGLSMQFPQLECIRHDKTEESYN